MTAPGIALALVAALATSAGMCAPLDAPVAAAERESKPMGPIAVDVHLGASPVVGIPVAVTITARADAIDRLELELRSDDTESLAIAAQSAPVDREGSRSWVVTVVPRAAGGVLSVVVSGEIENLAQAQSVTIGVHPAGAAPIVRALSVAPANGGGEKLSLLPVEERF